MYIIICIYTTHYTYTLFQKYCKILKIPITFVYVKILEFGFQIRVAYLSANLTMYPLSVYCDTCFGGAACKKDLKNSVFQKYCKVYNFMN